MMNSSSDSGVPLYQSGAAVVPVITRHDLSFESPTTPPLLVIPPHHHHGGSGKYNYSVTKDKPFSFEDVGAQAPPEVLNFNVTVEPDDFLKELTEPEVGTFLTEFDAKKFESALAKVPQNVTGYVPYMFKSKLDPMRPPDQIEEKERLSDIETIVSKNSARTLGDKITFIRLVDKTLPNKYLKGLGKSISVYTNLNVLILRSVGLKKVDDFNLPKLQYCDVAGNQIPTAKTLLKMWTRSPYLEVVKVKGNPVASKATFRPKIIANCSLFLKAIDESLISIEERIAAMAEYGPKQTKSNLGNIQWDLCFSACQEVRAMTQWDATKLVLLSLPKNKLETFNVGCLVNLEFLDLSKNKIRELGGAGLERCKVLKHLNLKANDIQATSSNFKVFSWIISLQYLILKNNPITKDPSYKQQIIFNTKFLKGNNRVSGLVELDEVPITVDERVDALRKITKHNINVDSYRWRCILLQYYGAMQINSEECVSKIQNCVLPKNKLRHVDLAPFVSLKYLDLSGNNLRDVNGLEALRHLRYLNLSENPMLKWQNIVTKQMAPLTTLEIASFMVKEVKDHQCNPENKKYRFILLKSLLEKNHNLAVVDEIVITPVERVEAYKMMKGVKNAQVEAYRFNLAATINATSAKNRKYHPSQVAIGAQYDPAKVKSLLRLHTMGLVSSAINFKQFINLEEINLSKNKLTDITGMGLQDLKKLRVLDVSENCISGSIKNLASFIDTLVTLECLAIRSNPVMKNWVEDRRKLIGSLKCVKHVNCTLRVIDTEISIAERVECWRKYAPTSKTLRGLVKKGSSTNIEDPYNKFRLDVIHFLRFPPDLEPYELKALDLHDCSLEVFDVRPYKNLEVLLLNKNTLKDLQSLPGFFDLGKLQVCDLRDNQFSKIEDFLSIVQKLPELVSLGISGNKATATKDYRAKFLRQIPDLHDRRFALSVLDNDPISIDEICDAWKDSKKLAAQEKFMHVLQLRKIKGNISVDKVVELDLSYCNIATIDLSRFVSVRKLSLKGNRIETPGLEGSRVISLQQLREFDVSNNKIQNLDALATVCTKISGLVSFYCDGNPAFQTNNEDIRVQFLAKLPQMRELRASLVLLNGFEIGIEERCISLEKKMEAIDLENFRMDLLFEKLQIDVRDSQAVSRVQALNLSRFGLTTLSRLYPFTAIRFLDVSHNNLTSLEQNVIFSMPWLAHLDIRENMLHEKGSKLLTILSQCRSLRYLFMKNSTADKSKTSKPKSYLQKICSVLRQLEYLDNLPNPFHMPQQQMQQQQPQPQPLPMPLDPMQVQQQFYMSAMPLTPAPHGGGGFSFVSSPPYSPQFPHGFAPPQGLQHPTSPPFFGQMTAFHSAPNLTSFLPLQPPQQPAEESGEKESPKRSPLASIAKNPIVLSAPQLETYKEASVQWGESPAPSKVHDFADTQAIPAWVPAVSTVQHLSSDDEDSDDSDAASDEESDYHSDDDEKQAGGENNENDNEKHEEHEEKEKEGSQTMVDGGESEFRKNKRFGKLLEDLIDEETEEESKAREEEKARLEQEEKERAEREEKEREEREREEEEMERAEREKEEKEMKEKKKEEAKKAEARKAKEKEATDSEDESEPAGETRKKGDSDSDNNDNDNDESDEDSGKPEGGGEDYWEDSESDDSEPAEFGGSSSFKSKSLVELSLAAATIDKDHLLAPVDYG